ncbi:MAG: hypothetical protein JSS81_29345 [Acidobacteria bacterium]|nr:hypothetical protein [Acidobacteriota bacterium]
MLAVGHLHFGNNSDVDFFFPGRDGFAFWGKAFFGLETIVLDRVPGIALDVFSFPLLIRVALLKSIGTWLKLPIATLILAVSRRFVALLPEIIVPFIGD